MASSSSDNDEPLTPNQRIAAKDWCFTIFPPRGEILLDLEECQRTITQWPYRYIVYQIELCPETGREHLQGFVQWTDKQRLTALKKFHRTAHWEKRLGTPYEAEHYCKKPVEDCTCKHCDGLERYDPRIFEEGFMSVENQHRFHEVPPPANVPPPLVRNKPQKWFWMELDYPLRWRKHPYTQSEPRFRRHDLTTNHNIN